MRRTDLSLDTQAEFTPCGIKEKCFCYSYPFSWNDCHAPILFSCPVICAQISFLSFATHLCAKANCISHVMIIYNIRLLNSVLLYVNVFFDHFCILFLFLSFSAAHFNRCCIYLSLHVFIVFIAHIHVHILF